MTEVQGGHVLSVRELHTEFATRAGTISAVRGVSFSVNAGEVLGIVGESGCGKSVTALSILRLVPPPGRIVSGAILFGERDLTQITDREMRDIRGREVGMVFQDPMSSLNPLLPVGRQIAEVLTRHFGLGRRAARRRAIELLKMVSIPSADERVDDYPHQFSGGMRQRVMIAMAVSCEPRLVIADEPTTALDVTIQAQILELMQRLQRETGSAIVIITHDLGVVAGLASRISVMYAGRVVETGSADDIFYRPRHPYTQGLLRSIPQIDRQIERLVPIPGQPPSMLSPASGCPFRPRCPYAIEKCAEADPPLDPVDPGHSVACWVAPSDLGGHAGHA